MTKLFKIATLVIVALVAIYGLYWVAKTASYNIFYEDMVQKTISETVSTECLMHESE